jgi:hypothetical protein
MKKLKAIWRNLLISDWEITLMAWVLYFAAFCTVVIIGITIFAPIPDSWQISKKEWTCIATTQSTQPTVMIVGKVILYNTQVQEECINYKRN